MARTPAARIDLRSKHVARTVFPLKQLCFAPDDRHTLPLATSQSRDRAAAAQGTMADQQKGVSVKELNSLRDALVVVGRKNSIRHANQPTDRHGAVLED